MRKRIPLGHLPAFDPAALRAEPVFLYRRLTDQHRQVLGVGELAHAMEPLFDRQGRALDWTFGHLCYDLKDDWHGLSGRHSQDTGFPISHWFIPRWVVEWRAEGSFLHVQNGDEAAGLAFADRLSKAPPSMNDPFLIRWELRTARERYLEQATRLLHHIQRGDIYEVNYCVQRTAVQHELDPFTAFAQLLQRSDAPFAAFYRLHDRYALCASPERFLAFNGSTVKGEPMKGTRPRGRSMADDEMARHELATDAKERSENIMAVDVMRNDLSQIAAPGSVKVEELCAVRSYPRVHQLVSTVAAEVAAGRTPFDVVRAAFPMASMTGAPKHSAMRLIDAVEDQPRGLYSGTLGFFAPDGTADLNVVIRTLFYNASTGVVSLSTGSALTATCDPVLEWEECELKARSVMDALMP